jgi:hypothetical protein
LEGKIAGMIPNYPSTGDLRSIHDSLELIEWYGSIKFFTKDMDQLKLSIVDIPLSQHNHGQEILHELKVINSSIFSESSNISNRIISNVSISNQKTQI